MLREYREVFSRFVDALRVPNGKVDVARLNTLKLRVEEIALTYVLQRNELQEEH